MIDDKDESLISHLEALRETLIKCFLSVAVILPFAFLFSPKILNYTIKIILSDSNVELNFFLPLEVFVLQIKLALLISFVAAFPYIIKKLWDFILPALYENERKFIGHGVLISTFLFILGIVFCFYTILPMIIKFGISFAGENIHALFGVTNVINLTLWLCFAFGLMFQVPLITYILIKFNVISYETISSKRPYVIVALLVFSALLTPPDVLSQLLLFIPTYLLFELGLLLSNINKNKRE